jgi:hypothetical protein
MEIWWHPAVMHVHRLNVGQRIVIVSGLGITLLLLGHWMASLNTHLQSGWVAFAPQNGSVNIPTVGGLHPWVRLVIWVILVLVWVGASLLLLRNSPQGDVDGSNSQH